MEQQRYFAGSVTASHVALLVFFAIISVLVFKVASLGISLAFTGFFIVCAAIVAWAVSKKVFIDGVSGTIQIPRNIQRVGNAGERNFYRLELFRGRSASFYFDIANIESVRIIDKREASLSTWYVKSLVKGFGGKVVEIRFRTPLAATSTGFQDDGTSPLEKIYLSVAHPEEFIAYVQNR